MTNNEEIKLNIEEDLQKVIQHKCCFNEYYNNCFTDDNENFIDCSNCKLEWHKECRDKFINDFSLNAILTDQTHCVSCYNRKKILKQREEKIDAQKKDAIKIVMRQTTYSEEQAKDKLEQFNYNIMLVLKNFMAPNKETLSDTLMKQSESRPINQKIFSEFRNMLEHSAVIMKKRQELEKKVNENYEKMLEFRNKQVNK